MASLDRLSHAPSIPASLGTLDAAAIVLNHVDELAPDATGALSFEDGGTILVQLAHVCWAVAPGMERRLTQLLRLQHNPPLDGDRIEDAIEECRRRGVSLGEGLLGTGVVSEEGLRSALFRHTTEAIAHIAEAGSLCDGFVRHAGAGYDPRFVFSTAEILAALGALRNRALAAATTRHLREVLVADARGLAFLCDEAAPTLCALQGRPAVRISEILDVSAWAAGVFDVTAAFDAGVQIAIGSARENDTVVSWRTLEALYVAVCANRATSALLMSRLDRWFERAEQKP
jgi:hypothetical protein